MIFIYYFYYLLLPATIIFTLQDVRTNIWFTTYT